MQIERRVWFVLLYPLVVHAIGHIHEIGTFHRLGQIERNRWEIHGFARHNLSNVKLTRRQIMNPATFFQLTAGIC